MKNSISAQTLKSLVLTKDKLNKEADIYTGMECDKRLKTCSSQVKASCMTKVKAGHLGAGKVTLEKLPLDSD